MPGKSGYEIADYLRRSSRLAHIPVVLLTSAFEPVDQDRAARAGCNGVLAKPFEPQLVIGRVKELLARPHPGPADLESLPASSSADAPDQGATPSADPRLDRSGERRAESTDRLDSYFNQLDAAFANLPTKHSHDAPNARESLDVAPALSIEAGPFGPEGWDLTAAPPEGLDRPVSPSPPSEDLEPATQPDRSPVGVVPAAPPRPVQRVESSAWATPRTAVALPPLADAFAMLLAAEQGQASAVAPAAATYSDALVAQVTRRVLDQLSDRAVRETVADIVTKVADRLVREEIDRIKSSMR